MSSNLEELELRRRCARELGGSERVRRQHDNGKLTARERVEQLVDPGSFREFGMLAGTGTCDGDKLRAFSPTSEVTGLGEIGG
jgi:acetyl-CoA carboxylase carboxyltransferase component